MSFGQNTPESSALCFKILCLQIFWVLPNKPFKKWLWMTARILLTKVFSSTYIRGNVRRMLWLNPQKHQQIARWTQTDLSSSQVLGLGGQQASRAQCWARETTSCTLQRCTAGAALPFPWLHRVSWLQDQLQEAQQQERWCHPSPLCCSCQWYLENKALFVANKEEAGVSLSLQNHKAPHELPAVLDAGTESWFTNEHY